ncbi:hypothetical protein [Candidatus Phytoplasma ziziphi]|uniref:helix-hairpin-helix domain-containing protein n=1 Tax=Candidatus Phytoplasma TaxID=33926 RepID=UPI001374D222|nr:hypothetical protein [Candidatus Phytoplasma ziziphi]
MKKTAKENSLLINLELVLESKNQNINFLPIDINESEISNFKIIDNQHLLLPFTSLDGLGIEKATEIINERNQKPFINFQDFKSRTKLNSKIIKILE